MSESSIKLVGLAIMMASTFAILFGIYLSGDTAPGFAGALTATLGFIALLVGSVLFVTVRKD